MALNPKIDLSLSPNGAIVSLYEKTDLYTTLYNTGGWGTPNIDTTDIVDAQVEILDLTSTVLDTFILKSTTVNQYALVSSSTPCTFKILETAWSNPDGVYQVVYTVEDSTTTFTNSTQYILCTTTLCSCRDSLIARVLQTCDAPTLALNKKHLDQIEIFLYGIQCAFACGEYGRATNILEQANIYCQTVSDCGCGC